MKVDCKDCEWCKDVENSKGEIISLCMDVDGGNYLGMTGMLGYCEKDGEDTIECIACNEQFTEDEIEELKEMGEEFHRDRHCFICPDCWDKCKQQYEDMLEFLTRCGDVV